MAYNLIPQRPSENWGQRYSGKATGSPVYDAAKPKADGSGYGAYIDPGTGHYWTGPVGTGYANNGIFSLTGPAAVDPNGAPKFEVTPTVKQPGIAGATNDLLEQQKAQQAALTPDLTKTLTTAGSELDRSYATQRGATDTSGVEKQLTDSMAGQEAAQRKLSDDQGEVNINYKAQTQGLLDKLSAQLNEGEAAANATASAAAARGVAAAQAIPLITSPDTATTRSGATTSRAINAVIQAMLPVTERFANARYAQTANIEVPLNRELFQNDSGLIAAKSALEQQFGGQWRSIFQYIQGLKQQAAQMDAAAADRYIAQKLALLGVPGQLLGGQISNLARLQQLDALATEYTFSTPYDASRIPATPNYPITSPGRSYFPNGGPDLGLPINPRAYPGGNGVSDVDYAVTAYDRNNGAKPRSEVGDLAFAREAYRVNPNRPTPGVYAPSQTPYLSQPMYRPGVDENGFPVSTNPELLPLNAY